MTDRPDAELVIAAWLRDEAPEGAPERLLTASRDRIQSTHQRHARWPAWRWRQRNTPIRFTGAVAAVAVVAVLGIVLVSSPEVGAPLQTPLASASPGDASSSTAPTSSPTALAATGTATGVAAGYRFTCAIASGGGVKCWGANGHGQLGNGTTTDSITPVDVSGLTSGVTSIALGYEQACALTSLGGVQCWGYGQGGQLGNGSLVDSTSPVDVAGLTSGATAIAAGGSWFCALTSGGAAKCWGWNGAGELGDGTTKSAKTPVDVLGLGGGATAIAGGGRHTCALTGSGGVKCWGYNVYGELGDGSTTGSGTAVDVAGLTSAVSAITAGDFYTCALLQGGGVTCWGRNNYGQLGDGSTTGSVTPVDVSGLAGGATAIAASGSDIPWGAYHTCALMTGGGVKCWGLNREGQLGNGTTIDSSNPVDVAGLAGGATAVTTGAGGHSCALTNAGGIKCWGANDVGQLGDGTTTNSSIPLDVEGL